MGHPGGKTVRTAVFVLAAALTAAVSLHAQESLQVAQNAPGFSATSSFENFGQGESVNTGNGGLTVTHPSAIALPQNMGAVLQPTRVYNSKNANRPWESACPWTDSPCGPLGMQWSLSFGRVFLRVSTAQVDSATGKLKSRCEYTYQDESGAEHRLFKEDAVETYNGAGDLPASGVWYYTNDSSFIRARFDDAPNPGQWKLYFPDGSTRLAGGTNAYVPQVPHLPKLTNSDGTQYYQGLDNLHTNGWWVTSITDRAGNPPIQISYKPVDAATPYPGSIDTITDEFGRTIVFGYNASGLVASITGAGMTETYDYTTADFPLYGNGLPVLYSVTAPQHDLQHPSPPVQVVYAYGQDPPVGGVSLQGPYLKRIAYPTGAVSEYTYAPFSYVVCRFPANPTQYDCNFPEITDAVIRRTLYVRALDSALKPGLFGPWNAFTWTYQRDWNPNPYLGHTDRSYPVVVTDPLGTQEVHFFSVSEAFTADELAAGQEIAVIRLKPGTSFSVTDPAANRVFQVDRFWGWGDRASGPAGPCSPTQCGDTHHCKVDDGNGGIKRLLQGNPHPSGVVETEYDAGTGAIKWQRGTRYTGWDGFGHSLVVQTQGEGDTFYRVTASQYELKKSKSGSPPYTYQLDRLTLRYTGVGQGSTTMVPNLLSWGNNPPDPPDFSGSGQFKAVTNTYDDTTGDTTGLVQSRRSFKDFTTLFGLDYNSLSMGAPPAGAGDAVTAFTYAGGNITHLSYTGGEGGGPYGTSFGWYRGMVLSLKWDNAPYTENDLTRAIDPATSRITSQSGANGLTTAYGYYDDGSLASVAPPGEDPLRVDYATDTTTWGSAPDTLTWNTTHGVSTYKGAKDPAPGLTPGDPASSLNPTDAYAVYGFDDLGRLWRTDTVRPDGGWTETTAFYDPLGRKVFASGPYDFAGRASAVPPGAPLTLAVPFKNGVFYGTWDSPYGSATSAAPFAGVLDPFYRTRRVVQADGSMTETNYDGLSSWATVFGIQTVSGLEASTTRYDKDLLGRLVSVTPLLGPYPTTTPGPGAAAAYAYDGLGRITQVTLTPRTGAAQTRTFTYDALGHLRTAVNPESGTTKVTAYDPLGNALEAQDQNGITAGYTLHKSYDFLGRVAQVQKYTGTTPGPVLAQWGYDDTTSGHNNLGQLTSAVAFQVKPDGSSLGTVAEAFTYDGPGGRLGSRSVTADLSALDAALAARTYTLSCLYNGQGQVTRETAARGTELSSVVASSYLHGTQSSRTFASGAGVQGLTFRPSGSLARLDYTNGTSAAFGEDPVMARLQSITVTGPSGRLWTTGDYAYDGAGNVTAEGSDTFRYDTLSRLAAATVHHDYGGTHAVGITYAYDDFGNLTGRATSSTSWMGPVEESAFKSQADFTATMDSGKNRILSLSRPGGGVTTLAYDGGLAGNGNVTGDGTTAWTYNALNQTQKTVTTGSAPVTEWYAYDASGERVAAVRYNASSVLESATYTVRAGAAVVAEERFGYGAGRVTEEHAKGYLYAGGRLVATQESWSVAGRITLGGAGLEGVTVSAGGASVVTDAGGYYLVTGTGNGSYTVRASMAGFYFTPFSRQVTVSGAGATAQDFAATAGSFAPPPVPDGSATGYSPLAASKGDAAGSTIHLSWDTTCSSGGYRLVYGMGSQLPASAGGTYGLSGSQCAMGTSPGTWSGAPDPSGDSKKFLWFLMVATDGASTEGPWGKNSGGTERTGPGAQGSSGQCGANAKNTSSTCGQTPLMSEGQAQSWPDGWAGGQAEGAQLEAFVLQNPTTYFYAWDHLGTVRLVTDNVGAVVDQHDFEPYGVEIRPLQNASLNTLRYTGYERDESTGLDYAHFRFLASTMGRFMKPDNIMGNPLNPQSWNLYSYVQGNPVNFNDPSGHMTGIPYRSYYSAGSADDIAGTSGTLMVANEWGGGLGLGEHPLDAGFGPSFDSWFGLAALHSSGAAVAHSAIGGGKVTIILDMGSVASGGQQERLEQQAKASMKETLRQAGIPNAVIYTQKEYRALPWTKRAALWLARHSGANVWKARIANITRSGDFNPVGHVLMVRNIDVSQSDTPAYYFADTALHEWYHSVTGRYLGDLSIVARNQIELGVRTGGCGEPGSIMDPQSPLHVGTRYFGYRDAEYLREALGY